MRKERKFGNNKNKCKAKWCKLTIIRMKTTKQWPRIIALIE